MVERAPVIAAWGAGVNSTAMIIELVERGEPIDMVLFADTGSEKTDTYAFIPIFRRWMDRVISPPISVSTAFSRRARLIGSWRMHRSRWSRSRRRKPASRSSSACRWRAGSTHSTVVSPQADPPH